MPAPFHSHPTVAGLPVSPRPRAWRARGLAWALAAALTSAHAQTPPPAVRPGEPVTLNFVNAEIEAVARAMASLSGRHVVVDPRVRGTLHLVTERPVSPATAVDQFGAELRLRGFALVESQGLYKVVPEADAKLQSATVIDDNAPARGQQIVTQVFRLTHENAANLVPVLRPLISPNNTITVNPGTNALVVTDYADNLRRLGRLVAAMDVAQATDVEVIPLRHALAHDLAPLLLRLIEGEGAAGGAPGAAPGAATGGNGFRTVLLADPRSNSLILRAANPARVALVRSLADQLDRPSSDRASGNIHVVYLKNADATQLAATLRAALAAEQGGSSGAAPGASANAPRAAAPDGAASPAGGAGTAATPATGGQIQADPATNALIISAPEPQYRQLRAVIDQLDTRRAQVYVESLIAEVNADKASEFGIQWQGALGRAGDSVIGLLGTNFGAGGSNIINLATQNAGAGLAPSAGLNIGLAQRTNGVYVLGALARFLEQSGEGNILSTPNLLTLDNEEAKIVIGQNVPFVTGQYTNNNSNSGSVNPFQTIERKDVGLTLRVKPQISENGTVKMAIFQEVSSVLASSVDSPSGLITNKRSIESSVLVDDGAVVVLGGLLQDEYGGNQEKVPGLGDVPLFGNLFKSEKRSRKKTNLMVFLRPVVLRDPQQSATLTLDRYELMRAAQTGQQPQPSVVHSVNDAPALPALDLSHPRVPLRVLGAGQDLHHLPVTPRTPER
ncbi:type II secretion system secretin GspD [Aquabacterium sp. A08]|uniref:type II secretion system secretin GspD n=1 Tax=Aquabacterium sp. A08 TaxID=2718532 RepID=UPI0014211730|nr:type II secretion system secretin GspD [Aquabacterium sp. A08]NIC42238.1 type II secretion system secretin GspD [Aquabacterium sp. A08]